MQTTSIQIKNEDQLRGWVAQAVGEILNGPDFGLELSEAAKKRLRRKSAKTMSFSEIKRRYR